MHDGVAQIPIEQRDASEVRAILGLHNGITVEVCLTPHDSPAVNCAFDVTRAHLITGLITERRICEASEEGVLGLYPEKRAITLRQGCAPLLFARCMISCELSSGILGINLTA